MESIKISELSEASRVTEHFDFGSSSYEAVSGGKVSRNLKNELAGKAFDPETVIDAYEHAKGIKRKPKANDLSNYEFKNIILDPEQQRDQDMLNELMNNKKYMIVSWKDTWTPQGTFRVFIIYGSRKQESTKKEN